MKTKLLVASIALLGSMSLSAYNYEAQILVGENYTDSDAVIDDSNAFGIRLNKYINANDAIMFGYTRLNDVDYNVATGKIVRMKGNRGCTSAKPCFKPKHKCTPTHTCHKPNQNQSTSTGVNNSDMSNNSHNTENNMASSSTDISASNDQDSTPIMPIDTTADSSQPTQPTEDLFPTNTSSNQDQSLNSTYASTDIDRFYINGLHHINTKYCRLKPYVYAGFGYERVEDEYAGLNSQGFFDAGLGLKYALSRNINVLADVQGVKKFDNYDLDVLASVGIGYLFGGMSQTAPETKVLPISAAPRNVTVVKVAPTVITETEQVSEVMAPVGEYYVQLATTFTTDMQNGCKYIDQLKDRGIDYDIRYTTIKGKNAQILVVGPYSSIAEAKENLSMLKKISRNAFIKRIVD